MNLQDLKRLDKDDILNALGLETRSSTLGRILRLAGLVGGGLLAGSCIALLFAPKPGRELRRDLRERMRRTPGEDGASAREKRESVQPGAQGRY